MPRKITLFVVGMRLNTGAELVGWERDRSGHRLLGAVRARARPASGSWSSWWAVPWSSWLRVAAVVDGAVVGARCVVAAASSTGRTDDAASGLGTGAAELERARAEQQHQHRGDHDRGREAVPPGPMRAASGRAARPLRLATGSHREHGTAQR